MLLIIFTAFIFFQGGPLLSFVGFLFWFLSKMPCVILHRRETSSYFGMVQCAFIHTAAILDLGQSGMPFIIWLTYKLQYAPTL